MTPASPRRASPFGRARPGASRRPHGRGACAAGCAGRAERPQALAGHGLVAVDGAAGAVRRARAGGGGRPDRGPAGALALGVNITSSHTPPGIEIADTVVQDVAFVLAAVYCAHIGGRVVRAWQFGLRPPGVGWRRAAGLLVLLLVAFLVLSAIWSAVFNPEEEKLLETARRQRRHLAAAAQRRADVRGRADLRGVPVPGLHLHRPAQLARDVARRGDHGLGVRRRARRLGAGAGPRAAGGRWASGCACCIATRARCIRASRRTR